MKYSENCERDMDLRAERNSESILFEENVFHNLRGKVDFLMSTLTDTERSVLGASALAWEVKEYSLFK